MGKRIVASAIALLLLTGCGVEIPTGYRPTEQTAPSANITEIAIADRQSPVEISGTTLEGNQLSTTDFPGVIVVNAWASWCAPCRDEWPILVSTADTYPSVNFLGLNEADDLAAATQFVADLGGEWEHLQDKNQTIATSAGVVEGNFLPGTIVLDNQHRIAAKFIGPVNKEDLSRILNQLAAE
jgi:thiol-disulfide isomerase/thioredoxin